MRGANANAVVWTGSLHDVVARTCCRRCRSLGRRRSRREPGRHRNDPPPAPPARPRPRRARRGRGVLSPRRPRDPDLGGLRPRQLRGLSRGGARLRAQDGARTDPHGAGAGRAASNRGGAGRWGDRVDPCARAVAGGHGRHRGRLACGRPRPERTRGGRDGRRARTRRPAGDDRRSQPASADVGVRSLARDVRDGARGDPDRSAVGRGVDRRPGRRRRGAGDDRPRLSRRGARPERVEPSATRTS